MITLKVRQTGSQWCVERDGAVVQSPTDMDGAGIFALDLASQLFKGGHRAQVIFAPADEAEVVVFAPPQETGESRPGRSRSEDAA